MRSVARSGVRGSAIAIALLTGCGGAHPSPAPAPSAARAAAAPIDTTGLPRIRFPRGTTSGINDDKLAAGATRSYVGLPPAAGGVVGPLRPACASCTPSFATPY